MTRIQWTETTWNPVTGCDQVSPGCDNCYAMRMARRLKAMGQPKYQTDGDPRTSGPGFGVAVHEDVLTHPLRWRNPRRVFVNSMSDLFHTDVPDEFIARVFAVMSATPKHTYQILTKRHARMRALLNSEQFQQFDRNQQDWPLPNVHLGVSAETQQWASIRVPALVDTPAAVRWVSAEPLLGPLDLRPWLPHLDWVVVGGESGPGARPLDLGWVRRIVADCQAAGTAVFVKQLGFRWGTGHSEFDQFPPDLQLRQHPTPLVGVA